MNEGDESKIDNLFKHEALEYKNSVPACLKFCDTILNVQNTWADIIYILFMRYSEIFCLKCI